MRFWDTLCRREEVWTWPDDHHLAMMGNIIDDSRGTEFLRLING